MQYDQVNEYKTHGSILTNLQIEGKLDIHTINQQQCMGKKEENSGMN